MGLREKKALRNRQNIVAEAVKLFKERGFAETTMESIAEAVELSPSTLYRYFPSKDTIVLESFQSTFDHLTEVFEAQPPSLSIGVALTKAIDAVLRIEDEQPEDSLLIRSIIDQSPAARAKLWDHLDDQRARLGALIAQRLGKATSDFEVVMSARIAILIVETAADVWRQSDKSVSSSDIARDLTRVLAERRESLPDPDA
ncbi:AcrR family transcriptional regulator [Psychromicrobium silvestre]|uniref:AcrR family transcriptional regulator n=1 Tax=Psychromicrobium silvestre TaxID=1645614 RepID=A0A7Y9LUL1_9MICC|nr:TetR family transcriptional regulator [Psychromicrobium silvestre]NYE95903.1 AcrR family transcriptional regulator [Psychromicrobium silvestre]